MRGIGVDGLVERKVRRRVIHGLVERRVGLGNRVCKASDEFIQVTFALGSRNRRARAVVVVEGEVEEVFVVEEILLAEEAAKGRVAQCVGFVGAEIKHGNDVLGRKFDAVGLGLQASECAVESIFCEFGCYRVADAASRVNVGVVANIVGRARVVEAISLDDYLEVDFSHVLGHAEETGTKVLGSLDHAVFTLGPEDGDLSRCREVVQEMAIQLAILDSQHKVFAATRWCEKLGTKPVLPVVQKSELTRERKAGFGGFRKLGSKLGWGSVTGGIPGSVTVQQVHLRDLAPIWDQRAGVWQAVVGALNRVPWTEIAPVFSNIKVRRLRTAAVWLWLDQRPRKRSLLVVRIGRRSLDSIGLYT